MIPRSRPDVQWQDLRELVGSPAGDPAGFERTFLVEYPAFSEAVWFPNARAAIRAYLETLEGPGTQAVVSPFNCVALANAIRWSGLTFRYVDTQPDGFNQDPVAFLEALESSEVKVGVAVPMWGDDAGIEDLTAGNKPVLYDYAQGGLIPDPPRLRDRDAVVYSFNPGKPVMGLRGGILAGDRAELAARWRRWRDSQTRVATPWWNDLRAALPLRVIFAPGIFGMVHGVWKLLPARFGQDTPPASLPPPPSRLDFPCAAVFEMGRRRLGALAELRAERKAQLDRYFGELATIEGAGIRLPAHCDTLTNFPLRTSDRDSLERALLERGVHCSPYLFDALLCDYPAYRDTEEGSFPRARELARTTLQIPLSRGLTAEEQNRVIAALHSVAEVISSPVTEGKIRAGGRLGR